jgi:hypothetical protein
LDPGSYADPDLGGYLRPICIRTMIPSTSDESASVSSTFVILIFFPNSPFVLDSWVLILNTDPDLDVDSNFWANWNPNSYNFGPETSARALGDRSNLHNFLMSYVLFLKAKFFKITPAPSLSLKYILLVFTAKS